MTNHDASPLALPVATLVAMSDADLRTYREAVREGAIDTNDAGGRWSVRRNLADAILDDRKANPTPAPSAPAVASCTECGEAVTADGSCSCLAEPAIEYQAVSTRTGSKVHTVTVIDGRGSSRTDCGASAAGMFPVAAEAVRKAHERGALCRNCIGRPDVFVARLAEREAPAPAEVGRPYVPAAGAPTPAEVAEATEAAMFHALGEAEAVAEPASYAEARGVALGEGPGVYRRATVATGRQTIVHIATDADGRVAVLGADRRTEVLTLGTLRRHEDGRRWYAARMDAYGAHFPATLHGTRREAVATLLAGTAYAGRVAS